MLERRGWGRKKNGKEQVEVATGEKQMKNGQEERTIILYALCLNGTCHLLPMFWWLLRGSDWNLLENKNLLIESKCRQFVLIIEEIVK